MCLSRFCVEKEIVLDLKSCSASELDEVLGKLHLGLRMKNGERYKKASYLAARAAISRYMAVDLSKAYLQRFRQAEFQRSNNSPWGQFKKDVSKWVFISFFSGEEGLSFDIERGKPEDDESVCWAEKNPVECCRKGTFFPPLSDDRYPPRIPDQVHVQAFKLVLTSIGLQLRHAWRSL